MSFKLQTTISKAMHDCLRMESKELHHGDENDTVRYILTDYFKRKSEKEIFTV